MCLQLMRHWQGGKDKLGFLFEQSKALIESDSGPAAESSQVFEVRDPAMKTAIQWLLEIHGSLLCKKDV
jgi:hypothetical protein